MTSWMRRYGGSLLLLILAFAYLTRMYRLHLPDRYMFDEVYHGATAKLVAQNDPRAFEWWNPPPEPDTAVDWLHPPLAKYFQGLSIVAFGENTFGWRFSSVLFGMLVIVVTYHLAQQLTKSTAIALAAAALSSLDGLLLVQSRIAMNDIHVTFFILLTLLVYARYQEKPSITKLFLVGLCAGLAIATKWSGIFVLATVWLLEAVRLLSILVANKWKLITSKNTIAQLFQWTALYLGALILLPVVVYVSSYSMMFLQGKDFNHFKDLHYQIWYYQTHLKETHPYQSRPWQWALNIRPVWYHVDYYDTQRGDIYAFGNPALFWSGLIAIMYGILLGIIKTVESVRNKSTTKLLPLIRKLLKNVQSSPLLFLTIAYFMTWLPWQFSPRIMFFYHYAPAVPLLCIILGYWLVKMYKCQGITKILALITWSLVICTFAVWYPHWVGIPVSNELKDQLYFFLPSWK